MQICLVGKSYRVTRSVYHADKKRSLDTLIFSFKQYGSPTAEQYSLLTVLEREQLDSFFRQRDQEIFNQNDKFRVLEAHFTIKKITDLIESGHFFEHLKGDDLLVEIKRLEKTLKKKGFKKPL